MGRSPHGEHGLKYFGTLQAFWQTESLPARGVRIEIRAIRSAGAGCKIMDETFGNSAAILLVKAAFEEVGRHL